MRRHCYEKGPFWDPNLENSHALGASLAVPLMHVSSVLDPRSESFREAGGAALVCHCAMAAPSVEKGRAAIHAEKFGCISQGAAQKVSERSELFLIAQLGTASKVVAAGRRGHVPHASDNKSCKYHML